MRASAPIGAALPHFVLPDRHAHLQRIDGIPPGFERLWTVGRRQNDNNRTLADLDAASAVQQCNTTCVGPPHTNLFGDLDHFRWCLFVVGLVRQMGHAVTTFGVIAYRSGEQHHRTAVALHRPLVGLADREALRGETDPGIAERWSMHREHSSRERGDIHWSTPFTTMPHVEEGDWHNDPEYPRAPLPAHERAWRHPSEVGSNEWATSEPPLVVGRGLSVATGTVGAALAVGLLWLMIPHHDRSGVSANASATSIRDITDDSLALVAPRPIAAPTASAARSNSTNSTVATFDPATSVQTTTDLPTPTTVEHDATPLPTMHVNSGSASSTEPATAVALTPGHFVITTAQAVNGRQGLEVVLPSGQTIVGAVVLVDKASGTAVLAIPTEINAGVVELSPESSQSPGVVMMSPEPLMVNVVADDSGFRLVYERDVNPGEGSLVLDHKGRLLGMCTVTASGATLVSVDAMLKALDAAAAVSVPAWLGIRPDAGSGRVGVASVIVDGPAAVSGIRAGDVIEAIDGVPITTITELGEIIAHHAAGDSVMLRLKRSGENAPVVLNITLSSHPDSM